jgi:hypothetical protein
MEQHQYEALRQDIHEIKSAIMGNEITQDGGIIKRLGMVETKTENHDKFISRLKWSGGILVTIAGVVGYLAEKFTSLFHSSNH